MAPPGISAENVPDIGSFKGVVISLVPRHLLLRLTGVCLEFSRPLQLVENELGPGRTDINFDFDPKIARSFLEILIGGESHNTNAIPLGLISARGVPT